MSDKGYEIRKIDNVIEFSTPNYRVEKTSVLHGGVYTREFSSMLLASAITLAGFVILYRIEGIILIIRIIILIILFIVSFLGSRLLLFKERELITRFDRNSGTVTVLTPGIFGYRCERISMESIEDIVIDTMRFEPTNIDGIRFVERISAQHGSAVPGLDQVEEFITMKIRLRNGQERIIYSAKTDIEPELPLKEIKEFIK